MSRHGLGRYGVRPASAVRLPATDHEDVRICPECGKPVENSKGTQRIDHPSVAEDGLGAPDELLTHGWRCGRHQREVVLPARAGGPDAPAMPDGWTGVALQYADGAVRYAPVPEREVAHVE